MGIRYSALLDLIEYDLFNLPAARVFTWVNNKRRTEREGGFLILLDPITQLCTFTYYALMYRVARLQKIKGQINV